MTYTIKDRIVLGIGLSVMERPRELQQAAGTNEHHVVHALYRLEKDGLTEFKTKRNLHSPGKNLTAIRLTPQGLRRYYQIRKELTKNATQR